MHLQLRGVSILQEEILFPFPEEVNTWGTLLVCSGFVHKPDKAWSHWSHPKFCHYIQWIQDFTGISGFSHVNDQRMVTGNTFIKTLTDKRGILGTEAAGIFLCTSFSSRSASSRQRCRWQSNNIRISKTFKHLFLTIFNTHKQMQLKMFKRT